MYSYQTQRERLFTDAGQRMFTAVRDNVRRLLKQAGAVRQQEALATVSGDSWDQIACLDRMVELGELRELTFGDNVSSQYRVFIATFAETSWLK